MKKLSLNETARLLLEKDNYILISHRRPDGDTCGSCAALCRGLRSLGKQAAIYENPQFTPKFRPFLDGLTTAVLPADAFYVTVDVAAEHLFPFGLPPVQVALAIDHHGTNTGFARQTLVQPEYAACGEIVWALLQAMGVQPDASMAEALYVAVSTDTGCFRYSNVTANTFRVAADCVACGANIHPINRVMFEVKRKPRLELEAYLIKTMEFYAGGKVAVNALPAELLEQLGLTEDDIDDISGFGRTVEGVQIAVMLRQVDGGAGKISVRTSGEFDAARICGRMGGGGHPAAAGATVPGGIPAAKQAVLDALAPELPL